MTLARGTRLGPYEVLGPIGAGGMGQVFRARDTRLGRDVAVKILPREFTSDPERLARFEREARVLASLNHPNIASIYGLENDHGAPALILELVDGETLADRLARGPVALEDALATARQIASALDAAHETGIVHRDLKPGNVALSDVDTVKVLDFGLAKVRPVAGAPADSSSAQTLSSGGTREGTVLGTAAYMSPEQARGQAVDKRADIWAFGCVLYEMLAGRRAFRGDTLPDTIAAVLEREPDFAALPASTPAGVRSLLRRCLEKDPRRRLRDIGDARLELDEVQTPRPAEAGSGKAGTRAARLWRAGALAAATTLLAVLIAVVGTRPRKPVLDTSSFHFVPLAAEPGDESSPSWSPDGRSVAYVAETDGVKQVFTRSLEAAVATRITEATTDCQRPFWSPDGTRIYFSDGNGYSGDLWSVGATGGEAQRVLKDASIAALAPDGRTLAFLRGRGGTRSLWIASTSNPDPRRYQTPPFPEVFSKSQAVDFSRDGAKIAVLLERQRGSAVQSELWVIPFPAGAPRTVLADAHDLSGTRISWMPDGRHIVLSGEFPDRPGSHLYLVDTQHASVLPITAGTVDEEAPAVSPAGDRIAFAAGDNDGDLFRVAMDGSRVQVLLASARNETTPAWSPTGSQFAYVTNVRGTPEIWIRSVQEGWARPVVKRDPETAARTSVGKPSFSPDGQRLAHEVYVGALHTVWVSSVADGRGVPLDEESRDQHSPAWSPDGRWVAYQRLASDGWELVKVPSGGGKALHLAEATAGGGNQTAWSPTGEWIAYVREQALVLASPDAGRRQKTLCGWPPAAFGFSVDGSSLFAVQHGSNGSWRLVAFDVASGAERPVANLDLPRRATLAGFSLHPDGRSFATAVAVARHDIWLLEGFKPPSLWLDRLGL